MQGYATKMLFMQLVLAAWTDQVRSHRYTQEVLKDVYALTMDLTLLLSLAGDGISKGQAHPEVTTTQISEIKVGYCRCLERYNALKEVVGKLLEPTKRGLKRNASGDNAS